ncbi:MULTISPECIES: 16S rRNA (uracil(1498)-N(3))-methyltransferase [Zunongwangia]|jgi:16S rRNA (uracil1498-N3)-methyltransferase|uniref:16S rRNA (uracil(1498)-N(3))-methyltransferase n=1 Tax=Zunongwangia TaxID=417127 RepID=UPI000C8D6BED|nr:16S rRNA (uracil(1498)-N(3))-methyltransferase [Zunongwangia profunda]MAG87077.1 16S rRNA (uracil(1498)-N(3))-methyltransferase [Flavobacteriaceae bacterium]MCC4229673.1 16S rRNA (uracil(1498)-N(3))-methyltransferase [Zunongwangia profunda]
MQLFFQPDIEESAQQIVFSREESKHIIKVLRRSEGALLKVTNGKGLLFTAQIINADIKQCVAKIIDTEKQAKPNYWLHLAVAPTKMNDRYEWFLEKATEIGVDEITPVICEHSERKVVKLDRYERVLQSAMKQSLHFRMPKLNEPVDFTAFIEKQFKAEKFIAHCEDDQPRVLLQHAATAAADTLILIGPEGDFSPEEIRLALTNKFSPVSLGSSRLRTETAAIVACHTINLLNETK